MNWHPDAERIPATIGGYSYINGVPWRLGLHTTEGGSVEGAVGAYRATGAWPHMTLRYEDRRITQHLPFTKACGAAMNRAGGVEVGRARLIQVEMVGHAGETHTWSDAKVDWFGRVLGPVMDAYGIRRHSPKHHGRMARWILATFTARQRFSFDAWNAFDGVCAHQHFPENDHWDCGKFRIDRFLAATGGASEEDELDQGEHDALIGVWNEITGGLKGGDGFRKLHYDSEKRAKERHEELVEVLKEIRDKL